MTLFFYCAEETNFHTCQFCGILESLELDATAMFRNQTKNTSSLQ